MQERCVREGCKEPAAFEYVGEIPPPRPRYEFQKYQSRYFLCLDHARYKLQTVLGYSTRGGDPSDAYLRRLDATVLRFRCDLCGSTLKYEYTNDPSTVKGAPRFCPKCGVEGKCAKYDSEQDYWDLLAKSLGNMDLSLVKLLYDEWTGTPTKYERFRDYVFAAVESVDLESIG